MSHLLSHLVERHSVTLLTFEAPDATPFYPIPKSVECLRIDRLGGNPFRRLLRILSRPRLLRRAVRTLAPDVVISFMDTTNITTLVSCVGLAVPVVISERIDPSMHDIGWLKETARRYTYSLARFIVTPTERVAAYFPASLRPKIRVIGNPIPLPKIKAKPSDDIGRKRIVAVGRCEPQKGFDRLIDAFGLVAIDYPDWDLVIVGDGPQRSQLEEQGRQLGLSARILFKGVMPDVFTELAGSDLMAFPSRYEGFPNALAEGLAAGLPAVGYAGVSGVEELILHGKTGLLVEQDSGQSEFARALSALMADSPLRAKLGAAAQRHVGQWAPERIFATWEALLSEATRRPDPSSDLQLSH